MPRALSQRDAVIATELSSPTAVCGVRYTQRAYAVHCRTSQSCWSTAGFGWPVTAKVFAWMKTNRRISQPRNDVRLASSSPRNCPSTRAIVGQRVVAQGCITAATGGLISVAMHTSDQPVLLHEHADELPGS